MYMDGKKQDKYNDTLDFVTDDYTTSSETKNYTMKWYGIKMESIWTCCCCALFFMSGDGCFYVCGHLFVFIFGCL